MASVTLDPAEVREVIETVAREILAAVDLEAIIKAAVTEGVSQSRRRSKPFYSSQETAQILGVSIKVLQARRLNGKIVGIKTGHRTYKYTRAEVERVLGGPIQ